MIQNKFNTIKIIIFSAILCFNLSASDGNLTILQEANNKNLTTFKEKALRLGQPCCFFSSYAEEPFAEKEPYFNILRRDAEQFQVIKCGFLNPKTNKNEYIKSPEDFENITPLKTTTAYFGINFQHEIKYEGERQTLVSKALEKLFLTEEKSSYKILVNECKKNYPIYLHLKDIKEFRAISAYLLKNFLEENFAPKEKTLLVLKIENDPDLETLDETDKEFLQKYFELFPLTDPDVKEFFEKNKEFLSKMRFDMIKSNPVFINESGLQGMLRQADNYYKEFRPTQILVVIGAFIAIDILANEISDGVKKLTQGITGGSSSLTGALINKIFGRNPS